MIETPIFKALRDGRFVCFDPGEGRYSVVPREAVPPLVPLDLDPEKLRLGLGAPPENSDRQRQLMAVLAMIEFQRRANATGDPSSSQPYLDKIAEAIKDPALLQKALRLSWRADESKTGKVKAVGEGIHQGRVLYGARAEAALRYQERLGAPEATPTPHPNRDQWQQGNKRAHEILTAFANGEHTPEELQELSTHLPYLPNDRLNRARSILHAEFKAGRGRDAQIKGLMEHIRATLDAEDAELQAADESGGTEEEHPLDQNEPAPPEVHPLEALAANHDNPEAIVAGSGDLATHDAIAAAHRGEHGPEIKAAVERGSQWERHGGNLAKKHAAIGKELAGLKEANASRHSPEDVHAAMVAEGIPHDKATETVHKLQEQINAAKEGEQPGNDQPEHSGTGEGGTPAEAGGGDRGADGGEGPSENEIVPQKMRKAGEPAAKAEDNPAKELPDFARAVHEAAASEDRGFADNHAFIHHVFDKMKAADPTLTREDFNKNLIEANKQGLVSLARADLPQAMHPDDVKASLTNHGNAEFHGIRTTKGGRLRRDELNPEWHRRKSFDEEQAEKNPKAEPAAPPEPIQSPTPPEPANAEGTPGIGARGSERPGSVPEPVVGGAGSGVAGGTDGQGGSEPARPRIVTARPQFTKPGNPAVIPDSVRKHLNPEQQQGASLAIDAMEKHGGFLLADGTGVGKTRQQLAVGQAFLDKGKKVVVVSPAEVIKPNWGKGTMAGSFAADSTAMGVPIKLIKGDGDIQPGTVHITTYNELGKLKGKIDKDTVLILDESHFLKNRDSARHKHGKEAMDKAGAVMYNTATPGDKPLHVAHLFRAGVFGNAGATKTYEKLGMQLVDQHIGNGQYVKCWKVNPKIGFAESTRRLSGLFDQMTKDGLMVKRELSMNGVDVGTHHIEMTPEQHADVNRVYEKSLTDNAGNKAVALMAARMHQEPMKIPATVEMIKKEIAEGRSPVVFMGRVNDIGDAEGEDGDDETHSVGTAKALKEALIAAGIPESDIGELHGGATKTAEQKKKSMENFQSGKSKLMLATVQSGGTGVNLDDTVGNRPRTAIMMTPPFTANDMAQAIGRIHRLNTKSSSRVRGVLSDTAIDQWNAKVLESKFKTLGAIAAGDIQRGTEAIGQPPEAEGLEDHEKEPFDWGSSLHFIPKHYAPTPYEHKETAAKFGGRPVKDKNGAWTTEFPDREAYEKYREHVAEKAPPKPAPIAANAPIDPGRHGFMRNKFDGWSQGKKIPAGSGWVRKNSTGKWETFSHDQAVQNIRGDAPAAAPPVPVEPVSPERKGHILAALRHLAGNDTDRARERNGVGFNQMDSEFGGKLAALPTLTDGQAHAAVKMLAKYRKQLGDERANAVAGSVRLSLNDRRFIEEKLDRNEPVPMSQALADHPDLARRAVEQARERKKKMELRGK